MKRGLHLEPRRTWSIGEAKFGNRLFQRHVPPAKKPPGEWVATHEQEVKDQHRQAKTVVVCSSLHATKRASLQLRRGEQRHADIAVEQVPAGLHLERVTVDQS